MMNRMYQEIMQGKDVALNCINNMDDKMSSIAKNIKNFDPFNVVIAARGTSCNAAKYAKYLIEIYCGLPVTIVYPSVVTKYNGVLNLHKSLVIGISQSGAAEDVSAILERANKNGALTIAITNTEGSLLMRTAKIGIDCDAGREHSVAATKTFVAQLTIITLLVSKLSGNESISKSISLIPEAMSESYSKIDSIKKLAKRYAFADECMVLARGVSYPVALEFAIKMQEACYIRAHGFAISDFAHGPIAMLERSIPVFIIDVDKETNDDVLEMLVRIKNLGVEAMLITSNKAFNGDAKYQMINLPEWCDGICGIFAATIIMQLMTCFISIEKGINPDSPRSLTKITITR